MNNLVTNTLTKISINNFIYLFIYLGLGLPPPKNLKARIPFNALQCICFQQNSHCHENISPVIISTILILELFLISELFLF